MKKILLVSLGFFLLSTTSAIARDKDENVCARGGKETAGCHARVIVDSAGSPKTGPVPSGYGPFQFRGAYNLSGLTSATRTVAVVDAYGDPNIFSDLNTYSTQFGIPKMNSCPVSTGTSTSPCFQKVDQNGGTNYPNVNAGWALETSLDVEVAHAICQNCNILLVQANSSSYSDLMTAVDTARLMGATVISNSYGSSEFSNETSYDSHFNFPGVVFTFSSGDSGYGSSYPAASQYVTAVGGTTLNIDSSNNYLSESAWNGAGSGCSTYESKPIWQTDSLCLNRTIADVSADADPNTGAAVYDSVRYQGKKGWFKVGGTSLSAPLIAGVYALSGNTGNPSTYGSSIPYSNTSFLHDVTGGSNGSCGGSYLCTSISGYDGPTGLGSPNGNGGF
ncbi:MAG TPA: S53 family peptidase [Candidatus Saccharimonadales bacterium]|nr:S53 family peptidase [Candidatus Saccharimonadales bacterium]